MAAAVRGRRTRPRKTRSQLLVALEEVRDALVETDHLTPYVGWADTVADFVVEVGLVAARLAAEGWQPPEAHCAGYRAVADGDRCG